MPEDYSRGQRFTNLWKFRDNQTMELMAGKGVKTERKKEIPTARKPGTRPEYQLLITHLRKT